MKSQVIRNTKGRPTKNGSTKRVFVGLSGGVDSSVSAALLKKAGYDVTGVFIKVWQPDWLACTWREERRDAMRVAAHLDIPFVTLDLEHEYKRDVVDYLLAEYRSGRTPNPDVMCNKAIKFGGFYEWAMGQGADYVATGHYSRVMRSESQGTLDGAHVESSREYRLMKGVDANKDQSYFLWNIHADQLPHILFPIGHLAKSEVRTLAKRFELPTAMKKDSQGICFIGMVDMKTFLAHYIETKRGDVLDEGGAVIGWHPGAVFFTIGERHGFAITKKGSQDGAQYVIAKDVHKNTVTVRMQGSPITQHSIGQEQSFRRSRISISETNWVGGIPVLGKTYLARDRYRQALSQIVFVDIDPTRSRATGEFQIRQDTITPGQSLVIYDGEVCVGGGVIV